MSDYEYDYNSWDFGKKNPPKPQPAKEPEPAPEPTREVLRLTKREQKLNEEKKP